MQRVKSQRDESRVCSNKFEVAIDASSARPRSNFEIRSKENQAQALSRLKKSQIKYSHNANQTRLQVNQDP
jgi:hypothetical protein